MALQLQEPLILGRLGVLTDGAINTTLLLKEVVDPESLARHDLDRASAALFGALLDGLNSHANQIGPVGAWALDVLAQHIALQDGT